MSNNKQSSVEWLIAELGEYFPHEIGGIELMVRKAKAMQQEQAHLYAAFVLKCVQNNLPPITFKDWINLDNNDQQ